MGGSDPTRCVTHVRLTLLPFPSSSIHCHSPSHNLQYYTSKCSFFSLGIPVTPGDVVNGLTVPLKEHSYSDIFLFLFHTLFFLVKSLLPILPAMQLGNRLVGDLGVLCYLCVQCSLGPLASVLHEEQVTQVL